MNLKNKISNIPVFVSTIGLACLLLLAGCSQDDVQTPDDGTKDGNVIRFTSTIIDFMNSDAANDPETRATINPDGTGSFTNGDPIGLWTYMVDFPDFIISNMSEMYTLTSNGNTWDGFTPTWNELGEPTAERQRFFFAHYPQQAWGSSDNEFKFSVATDQSTIEAYEASDLLEAQSRYSEKPQDGTVNLSFYHAMARITVKLVGGNGVSADEVNRATIILKNMPVRCAKQYSGGTETDVASRDDIIPRKSDSSGTNTFYALVPPHSVENGLEIEITVSGKVVSYKTMKLKHLASGNEYLITLTLTNSGASYLTYLTGWYRNDNYDTFVYTLVNDAQTVLSPPAGGSDAYPKAMAVSGGKTYVSGGYFDTDGWARACYWVNGSATKLEVPDRSIVEGPDYSESILVSGGKIYVAGSYNNNDYRNAPCYWVDGVLTTLTLPAGASEGAAASIAVLDGKIYAVGYHANSSGTSTPGYWLDGSFVQLPLPEGASFRSSETMNIAISDNKVYVMGTYFQDSRYSPCVWIDGTRNELVSAGSAALGSVAQSMTIAGGKVYVSGYSIPENRNYRKGCYWVDGVRTDLSVPDDTWSEAASIGVISGKVYVGGEHYTDVREKHPCYWVDGVRTGLDIPTGGTSAGIKAIYLSE